MPGSNSPGDGGTVIPDPPWAAILAAALPSESAAPQKWTTDAKCQLIFSLLMFLSVTVKDFLLFIFESQLHHVRTRAGIFMAYSSPDNFGPARLYNAWHSKFKVRQHLHDTIVSPCAHKIVLSESDRFISDPKYKVVPQACTVDHIMETLDPGKLAEQYRESVPFTWSLLSIFTTSPNRYRKYNKKSQPDLPDAEDGGMGSEESFEGDDNPMDTPEDTSGSTEAEWKSQGFVRNPIFTLVFVISMMTFTRNTGSNLFAMIQGLFLEIGGTSARVISTLSNAGICISVNTIERLKTILSADSKRKGVDLMKGRGAWYIIFDNINIYLRKFEQRLFNSNSMINATNAAVISLPGIDPSTLNLDTKLSNRGKRAKAKGRDVIPTREDDKKIHGSYIGLVMQMTISYCPGSARWKDRAAMSKMASSLMASDRPLPPEKTDARPLGVYDIDEGSKKGIVEMLKALQVTSTKTVAEWGRRILIMAGDYLTTRNMRSARRDRANDCNGMERLEYVEDLSQLFHFALNASHMLMRLHFGNAILDPGSLAKHKGLLNRTWDASKPNYADGKALIRHSLIARILYCIMLKNKMAYHSQLTSWQPTVDELQDFATQFVNEYTSTAAAEAAKDVKDDYLAHSIYFIRDALLFCEFEHAVSHADAGRVLRVLKYWALSFRGAGLNNYARECLEIILRWKYELDPPLQRALEKSWFVNRWGLPGRWIAADLYLEQLNFWVKRVFIAKGSNVTVQYIIDKGSSCIEVFRDISHKVSRTFGHADRARRHKEVKVDNDLRLLCEDMMQAKLHVLTPNRQVLSPPKTNKAGKVVKEAESAIVDCYEVGITSLNNGKFKDFLQSTTWDPALGFQQVGEPDIDTDDPVFGSSTNPIVYDGADDVDCGDDITQRVPGSNGVGGGLE